jgi:thiol-disulfide isomerase/thioredoxin
MKPGILYVLMLAAGLVAGCDRRTDTAQPLAIATPAPAREIAWFKGSVDQAMTTAGKENKLLFIYWGAKWCPYCQALRKTVFTRPDFIEKTALFVPVYLDGDLPGAQAWGETFKISGYPTLLVLKPDRTELARLSGGMDLSLYASVLDEALQDQRPILDVLAKASTPDDCHRLSYYAWEPDALAGVDAATLADRLSEAAARCQGPDQVRLQILALNLALQARSGHVDSGDIVKRVQDLYARLGRPEDIRPAFDLLPGLDDSLFTIVTQQGVDFTDKFRARWVQSMQAAADDQRFGDADRLIAFASALHATRTLAPDHVVPASMRQAALDRIRLALAADRDRFQRTDLINAANIIYDELGDYDDARAMYLEELPNTRTPYYYMSHLAAIAEKQGKPQEALEWMSKAYAASEGPATRIRWGSAYVRGLIRLAPDDTGRIRTAALQVAADLPPADALRGRPRVYWVQLDQALDRWANTPERRSVAAEVKAHVRPDAAAKLAS